MIRLLLRALNGPSLILLASIGIAVQTSLFASYPLLYFQPDVILVIVIWCALRRDFAEGGVLTLILAYISEIHSAAPAGMMLISYMTVYLIVRAASKVIVIPNLPTLLTLTSFASIFVKIEGLGILHLMGLSQNQWRHTLVYLFPGAVTVCATAIWAFQWLETFDRITYKNERALQMLDEELQLQSEGY